MPARRCALRVVSLLPSATENVCALLSACVSSPSSPVPQLVGRSHECDFPADASVQQLPVLTAARTAFTSSADTHSQVREALSSASSLYHLDAARLAALRPDVILTQSSCKVCSIDLASVRAAVDEGEQLQQLVQTTDAAAEGCELNTGGQLTQIVTCNPTSLEDALVTQFRQLGEALDVPEVGEVMAQQHGDQLQQLKEEARGLVESRGSRPRVLMVEWLEPLFLGTKGWMREIVEAAGGRVVEGLETGEPVDVVVVALCGLSLDKTETELLEGRVGDWWTALLTGEKLPKVFIVDGTSMFTRPTRRLLVALEWLVHALHEPEGSWMKDSTFPYKLFDTSLVARGSKTEETMSPELLEIEELHRAACVNKQAMYTDPATGYSVMTAYILKERQVCCGNGCRHCPYGHANVKDPSRRKNKLAGNVFLRPRRRSRGFMKDSPGGQMLWPEGAEAGSDAQNDLVVMFWSGGKDSFLALSALYESYAAEQKPMPRVVLLTTIDPKTNVVPIQNISSQTIAAQAEALELPLCLVAVGLGDEYTAALRSALHDIPEQMKRTKKSTKNHEQNGTVSSISLLVFGDLHLEDIRAWREQTFGQDYTLRFPVWRKDYESELLPSLERLCSKTGAKIYFSSIDKDQIASKGIDAEWQVGQEYDWKLVQNCNKAAVYDAKRVDLMGECGEFHTCVKFQRD
ncbi:hypothetical protein PF005_g15447 [Phytophthora fragariae]|uniref:Diphthine--ammonia ligase n=1 Tax=Phytophthora fragariae TaxID=53985 RepID=A0A6A3TC48_9STRA|nr:hypothetical protein PF003_g31447 [Phytophthora fragariae]KAE8933043.1 hypothetical protein PF009_g16941 [Phytophthora fragariae]KAE8992142.1 hypothetical protein PF011_g17656 [Phytophthora fragariae]KAE9089921.1 hypothetical protein PF010_g18795 [Phytophthora fragariae]KAE9095121.1 hypothetical protein PF007_g17505 [Phytophthora fragariae]